MTAPLPSPTDTPLCPALIDVLVAGRPQFNARVAGIRKRVPNFDAAAFAAFVRGGLDAVAQAVAAHAPERTAAAVSSAFDIGLELVAQGLAGPGARTPVIERIWCELAPRFAHLLATDPRAVLGMLGNAALYLAGMPGARGEEWQQAMAQAAPLVESTTQLRQLGQVLAWRCGLAHFRAGALDTADALPPALALHALGGAEDRDWPALATRYRSDPWWSPRIERQAVRDTGFEVGSFTGFGGSFAQPPEVRGNGDGFVVRSADRCSLLLADVHGAVLLPATAAEFEQAPADSASARSLLDGNRVAIGARRIELPLPADGLAIAGNAHTLAVCSPYTHAIRLLPRA